MAQDATYESFLIKLSEYEKQLTLLREELDHCQVAVKNLDVTTKTLGGYILESAQFLLSNHALGLTSILGSILICYFWKQNISELLAFCSSLV